MQNEMVRIMALSILQKISANLQSTTFYTVMLDETTDVANVEQSVVFLRWVSERFEVNEEFVALYEVELTETLKTYDIITDFLL